MNKSIFNNSFAVKGIRRISPARRSQKDTKLDRKDAKLDRKDAKLDRKDAKQGRKDAKNKNQGQSMSSKSVVEFQFYSMLEFHGVSRPMLENQK